MGYGPIQVFTCGIASGASTSSYIDMGGKSYSRVGLTYVTMSTGALVTVYGANAPSDTYLPIQERQNTATVQYASLTIPTTTSGSWVFMTPPPFRYLKFVTSAAVAGGVSFTVTGAD